MFDQFYKNKTVLVLGHTGFKGAWLTQWLLSLGANVIGYSSYIPSEPALFNVLNLENSIIDYRADVCDLDTLLGVCQKHQPEIIFHLAAQPIVKKSYEQPKETFNVNVNGTIHVLEAVRQTASVKTALFITSDKCYENVEWAYGYREDDRLGGKDPYSASKACAELAIHAYWHSFLSHTDKRIASVRAGNVIGGGDWADHRIVPDCIRAWSQNQSVSLRAPQATRPWQHVLEPLSGYLWLGRCLNIDDKAKALAGQAFNFGPDASVNYPVLHLIERLSSLWPGSKYAIEQLDKPIKEAGLLKLSCDKALHLLSWQATLAFEQTVDFTCQWYKSFYNGCDMSDITKEQIVAYCQLANQKGMTWTAMLDQALTV
jgi:CDP-glucose 4,6-dehydratase